MSIESSRKATFPAFTICPHYFNSYKDEILKDQVGYLNLSKILTYYVSNHFRALASGCTSRGR